MNKPELILLVGPPACGKTTWANAYRNDHDLNTLIVGRDKLREMLFGYSESTIANHYVSKDFKEREQTVTTYQHLLIREALAKGTTVIVDDTNLDLDRLKKFMRDYDRFNVDIIPIRTSREDCLERNRNRVRQVDPSVINKMYDRFESMLSKGLPQSTLAPIVVRYVADPFNEEAYIVDLDGTLATCDHRPTFNCTDEQIIADRPIEQVVNLVSVLIAQGYKIVFLSGREDKYYAATLTWLTNAFIQLKDFTLFMRKTGDFRKDSIIKQELFWQHIALAYNVQAAIDDRKQVKQMWHDLGVFVFDVNQTDAWF